MIRSFARLLQLGLLALPLGLTAAPASATTMGRLITPDATASAMTTDVQYYGDGRGYGYGERRHRRPRCWMENRRVRVQDRYGRVFVQIRPVRVCR